jgi:hypothetical protein
MDGRVAVLLVAVAAGAGAGCKTLECGKNTIEKDDMCSAEAADPSAECGPGTVYNKDTGRCENALFLDGGGICGPNTTLIISDAGIRTCVGTGGGGDCSQDLPCTDPSASNVALCGRVYDLEDSRPLGDGTTTGSPAYKTIELRVYDPIAFATNPSAPILLKATPDACGRFAINNAPHTLTGYIALATDDITDGSGTPMFGDNHVLTGIAAPAKGGDKLDGLHAWVFRRTTDASWSAAAGLANGNTFGKIGVYIPIFLSGTPPVAPFLLAPTPNVMVALFDMGTNMRVVHPENDFYFSDTDPLSRKAVAPAQSQTGADGTALYINQPTLGSFSGIGNAGAGACWRTDLAAAPAGAAYVQERNPGAQFCP